MQEHIAPAWTLSQLYGLAPDRFALKNGRDQANSPHWLKQQKQGHVIWGTHRRQQASLPPHRIVINLSNLQTHCTCGSQKSPCKFTIGLLIRYKQLPNSFVEDAPVPDWVTDWLTNATKPIAKKNTQDANKSKPEIEALQEGMREFALWLRDQVDHGLSSIPNKASTIFPPMIHRLYDMRATEIAHELKQLQQKLFPTKKKPTAGWAEQLLASFGRFYLLTQAWAKYDQLSVAEQVDLRLAVGLIRFDINHPDIATVHGQWRVLGRRFEVVGKQRFRRTWIQEVTNGRLCLLTDSIHGRRDVYQNYATDSILTGTAYFYPATQLQHGVLDIEGMGYKSDKRPNRAIAAPYSSVAIAKQRFRQIQTKNPWLQRLPSIWHNSYVRFDQDSWWLVDQQGQAIRLKAGQRHDWHLLSHNGGRPLTLFGELYANQFEPLSLYDVVNGRWIDLSVWGTMQV